MTHVPGKHLGRKPADPAALARAPQLGNHMLASMPAPPVLDRSKIAFTPDMDGNDTVGDCTAVALANCARAAACLAGFQIVIPKPKVIAFYSQSTGYNPKVPSTDQGGVEVDVLANQARHGFDIGEQTPLVGAWGTFDPGNQGLMRSCIANVGTCYIGVALSISDQNMKVWDTDAPASAGDPTPGSWGDHAPFIWDYEGTSDTDLVRIGTWGYWQKATWRWVRRRTQEAHGIAWRQMNKAGTDGLDYDRLLADSELFSTWVA